MQIRRGREADTSGWYGGPDFETEQEIPWALTPLLPENRPQWWCGGGRDTSGRRGPALGG